MRPSELPDHYFPSVQARDIDRFISLFADDAIMILPDGRQVSGAPTIARWNWAFSRRVRPHRSRLPSSLESTLSQWKSRFDYPAGRFSRWRTSFTLMTRDASSV
jgi:hypothetical protein